MIGTRALVWPFLLLLLGSAPAFACLGCVPRQQVGPSITALVITTLVLLVPAWPALRSQRGSRAWLEVAQCGLVAMPLSVASAAAVRLLEEHVDEPLDLPWDAGLVPPYLAVALATLALGTTAQWLRRREREAN